MIRKIFRNLSIIHWLPTAFCAYISFTALTRSTDGQWWTPAFFSFLPMCFFYVGAITSQMSKEIRDLKKQLGEIQGKGDLANR